MNSANEPGADMRSTGSMLGPSAEDHAEADTSRRTRPTPDHPTRREDGRTPNRGEAEAAIAAAMNVPVEALELLDQSEKPVL